MRTYRSEIRLIQLGVLIAALVVISGLISPSLWGKGQNVADKGSKEGQTAVTEEKAPLNAANQKIVALGDSFTFGYPGTEDKSWPKRLGDKLGTTVVNKGKIQQTTKDLLDRFDQDVVTEDPGIVIIFGGNGDALNGVPLETFQENIQALVEKAKSNHITPVLALPLPYKSVQEDIRNMRKWETEYAETAKIRVLDFSTVLMNVEGIYLEGLSGDDGKYPTAKGYEKMGDYAANILK